MCWMEQMNGKAGGLEGKWPLPIRAAADVRLWRWGGSNLCSEGKWFSLFYVPRWLLLRAWHGIASWGALASDRLLCWEGGWQDVPACGGQSVMVWWAAEPHTSYSYMHSSATPEVRCLPCPGSTPTALQGCFD